MGGLLLGVLRFLSVHLGVLPLETPSQDKTAKHSDPSHDSVDGEGEGVHGRVLLVVQVRGPDLRD